MKLFIILIILIFNYINSFNNNNKRALLENINVLNFRKNQWTVSGGRNSPMKQLNCVGGNACYDYEPEIVHCKNVGFDGYDVSWECSSDLPNEYKFGATDVSCEGYNSPNDPYILAGSCALEYTLHRTPAYRNNNNNNRYSNNNYQRNYRKKSSSGSLWNLFGIGCILYIVYRLVTSFGSNTSSNYRGGNGSNNSGNDWGGGGPGGKNYILFILYIIIIIKKLN